MKKSAMVVIYVKINKNYIEIANLNEIIRIDYKEKIIKLIFLAK